MIRMPQRVTGLQVGAVRTLVDLNTLPDTHRRSDPREHLGMHRRERGAVRRLPPRCGDSGPGEPAPPLPQIVRAGGDPRHGNRSGPDLVRHVLADEDHFDRRGGTWPLAAEARDADEEVQTAHLGSRGVVDRREATAAESGEDRLRGTADQHHRDGGIDRAAAAGEYVSPRLRGRWMPSGYSGPDLHRSPFLTPGSLVVATRRD